MTSEMLSEAGKIITILDSMNDLDRDTTIAMLSARFGGFEKKTSSQKSGKGGGGTEAKKKADSPKKEKKSSVAPSEVDFTDEIGKALAPVLTGLPKVIRQQGASKPHMDLKSVQRRINVKRRELQQELAALVTDPTESFYVFRSLNAIQSFRLAARDASTTKGCRVSTDPIPQGFDQIRGRLKDICNDLIKSQDVSSNGFFTDEKKNFVAPIGAPDEISNGQDESQTGTPW